MLDAIDSIVQFFQRIGDFIYKVQLFFNQAKEAITSFFEIVKGVLGVFPPPLLILAFASLVLLVIFIVLDLLRDFL